MSTTATVVKNNRLLQTAYLLSGITILYNLIEGGVSTYFGFQDETLALFGFGIDSFIEVLSAIGITHMIYRMRRSPVENTDRFEKQALRITGISFYILATGLLAGGAINLYSKTQPETTLAGLIISVISIITMYALYKVKLRTGESLNSEPIISDANCTKTCFYLSFILLASSRIYEIFHVPYIDAIGGMGISYYAIKKGKEAFGKAKRGSFACSDDCQDHS